MNRRRKVGSTLLLSSVAALAIVGMGLAAATLPAEGNASFGFEWTPAPEEPTPIGTVAATTSMDTVKLVVDEAAKTATMNSSVQFAFTPDETLTGHTFSLTYSFTLPESFDTYFTLTAGEGEQTIQADEPQTYAEGDVTFTIPETALAATLTGDFAEAQTALADGNITINVTVNDTTGEEPVEPSGQTITSDYSSGWEDKTLGSELKFISNIASDDHLLEALNSGTETIATAATIGEEPAGNSSGSYLATDSVGGGIKFASGNRGAALSFDPAGDTPVKEMTIKAVAWNANSSFTVNSHEFTFSDVPQGTTEKSLAAAEEFHVTFDTPADQIDISCLKDNTFVIVGLTLTM